MKTYEKVFQSENNIGKTFQLATGYVSTTEIFFVTEGIVAKIEANGSVEFFDREENLLARVSLPEQTGGRAVYTDVLCEAKDGSILLKFPIVEWIDNYPNCDGEHDRWDTRTIGYHVLTLDLQTNQTGVTAV